MGIPITILLPKAIPILLLPSPDEERMADRPGEVLREGEMPQPPLQSERGEQNLEKVLQLVKDKGEVTNDDVQFSLGVSDATATRCLDELEKNGRIIASGTGKGTIYRLK